MTALTLIEAINLALREELARDERVVLLGQDIGRKGGVFGVTRGLQADFGPLRVMDTPIAEVGIAGMAIGAALCGLRPVAEFQFADYLHPAFDQIVNEAATISYRSNGAWRCPAVFRAPCGAGVHGGLYHSQSVEAYYAHVPGLKVVVPATPEDARGLLKSAVRDDAPVVFLEHKGSYRRERQEVSAAETLVPLGEARLERAGRDATVLTYGIGVHWARAAAPPWRARGSTWRSSTCARCTRSTGRRSPARWPGRAGRWWCTRPTAPWGSAPSWPRSWRTSCSRASTRRCGASPPGTATCPTRRPRRAPSSPGPPRWRPRSETSRDTDAGRWAVR